MLRPLEWSGRSARWLRCWGTCGTPRAAALWSVLALAAVLAIAAQAWWVLDARKATAALRDAADRRAQAQQDEARRTARIAASITPLQLQSAGDIAARLNVDWVHLLDELERLTPMELAVIEIEPQAARSRLNLTVEARNARVVFDFVAALNASPRLRDAHLVKHETNAREAMRPLRFVVATSLAPGDVAAPPAASASTPASAPGSDPSTARAAASAAAAPPAAASAAARAGNIAPVIVSSAR